MNKQTKIKMLKELLRTKANDKNQIVTSFGAFSTFDEIHKKVEEIMGRPVWTHELAYSDLLLEELQTQQKGKAFTESLSDLKQQGKKVMIIKAD